MVRFMRVSRREDVGDEPSEDGEKAARSSL